MKLLALSVIFVLCASCNGQVNTDSPTADTASLNQNVDAYPGPFTITRNIIEDRKGRMWMAAFDGIFRYDGKSFTKMTTALNDIRFFSVLEDRKGNLWFGSIGSGVYRYNGHSFQQFTTQEGLANNEIVCIYEDKAGNIWLGANGGASCYDGHSFRNYMMTEDSILEDKTGKPFPDFTRPPKEVNSIVEDKTGKLWLGTREKAFVYNGKTFTPITHDGETFTNVRCIIEDRRGAIWLGGNIRLWRYDGSTFTNVSSYFVGYIYEDKAGNIWTSSQAGKNGGWVLSRYDETSLSSTPALTTQIGLELEGNAGMTFGIAEATDGTIWFGALDGVHRYDGKTISDFKEKKGRK